MAQKRHFGEVAGQPEGTWYPRRKNVKLAGLHSDHQRGISGTKDEGADAIVLSDGYSDDEDHGEVIVYTGQGGQDENHNHIEDQSFKNRGNSALVKSQAENLPVRVISGSTTTGYRYRGLYRIVDRWRKKRDEDGFYVCQFGMVKIGSTYDSPEFRNPDPTQPGEDAHQSASPAERYHATFSRIQRNAKVVSNVKARHKNICQICGETVNIPIGPSSEAAHIRPLGEPHNGPDTEANALCLCPNDHVRFDKGALYITDNFEIFDTLTKNIVGQLRRHPEHRIEIDYIRYHRDYCTPDP